MPLAFRSSVVDITRLRPRSTDVFLVDTNVWYWLTYTRASTTARAYQVQHYPDFISRALTAKAILHYAPETIAELAHIIERCEYNLHVQTNQLPTSYRAKEFRQDPALRPGVVSEIELACQQVMTFGRCLDAPRDGTWVQAALGELKKHEVDGYDAFVLAASRAAGVTNIVTDDSDFVTCSGLAVMTANRYTLTEARTLGKLLP